MTRPAQIAQVRKVGRPPIQIEPEKVEQLAAQGLNQRQIAACLGVNEKLLIERRRKYKEFEEAMERGKAKGIATVTNALFNAATSGNYAAQQFYLKNRAPDEWSDRQELTVKAIRIDIDKDDQNL